MNNVILDCDTGEDDALAILLAVANKLPLKYIVTSYGNTTIAHSTRNTSRLLGFIGAHEIQVVKGSSKPLYGHPHESQVTAGAFVGKNGLCNTTLPPVTHSNIIVAGAVNLDVFLSALIQKQSPVDYIITGPCTNFAKICMLFGPDVKKYVKNVFVMGGALQTAGNSGPRDPMTAEASAEFNFYCDPYAVRKVFQSRLPIHLVTWDMTSTVTIPYEEVQQFTGTSLSGVFAATLMKNFLKYYGLNHGRNFELNDPLTILAYLGLGTWSKTHIKIATKGIRYGKTTIDHSGFPVLYLKLTPAEKKEAIKRVLQDIGITSKHHCG